MSDETWISEASARNILRQGDFSAVGVNAVLAHSLKKDLFGGTYYPLKYIQKRSDANKARPEINANDY